MKGTAFLFLVCHILKLREAAGEAGHCEDEALGMEKSVIGNSSLTSSSAFNSETPAQNARLNSVKGPWCASKGDKEPYLTVNLEDLHIICAIATQGDSKADQWVETYQLQTSSDGTTWTNYTEGGQVRDFHGNSDRNTINKQALFEGLVASYVRVLPKAWHVLPCLRMELYGADGASCRASSLNVASRSKFPDYRMTATSFYNADFTPDNGRLNGDTCWKPRTNTSKEYLQLDLGGGYFVCAIKTQGNGKPDSLEWTTKFQISLSFGNVQVIPHENKEYVKAFEGNKNAIRVLQNLVSNFPRAKFIRFHPTDYNKHPSFRVEVYGTSHGCRSSLGIEGGSLDDSQITAQPMNTVALNPRLYNASSGCNSSTNAGHLQVDLGRLKTVTGVAVQGDAATGPIQVGYRFGSSQLHWSKTQGSADSIEVSENVDKDKVRISWFPTPIVARFIQVKAPSYPLENGTCFRIDLYGCDNILRPRISLQSQYLPPIEGSFVDVVCKVTSQPYPVIQWWLGDTDVTSLSSGVIRSNDSVNGVSISTLRVNFTSVDDIRAKYDCVQTRSHTLECAAFRCAAFYAGIESETIVTRSAAVSTILSPPKIFLSGPKTLIVTKGQKNVTVECRGRGSPTPKVMWFKGNKTVWEIPLISVTLMNRAVQVISNGVTSPFDNVTSQLHLHSTGITYEEAGNYSCKAINGIKEHSTEKSIKVLFLVPPYDIKIRKQGMKYIISWEYPQETNGIVLEYQVDLKVGNTTTFDKTFFSDGSTKRLEIDLKYLNGDKKYSVIVRVKTSEGLGVPSTEKVWLETPATDPPVPVTLPEVMDIREGTTIRISIPEFSDINGKIIYYRVFVTRIPEGTKPKAPKPSDVTSYEDAHESSEPATYVTFQFKGSEYHKYKEFIVGGGDKSDSSHRDRRDVKNQYYNGPLESGTEYIIFARAYTGENTYSDSKEAVVDKVDEPVVSKKIKPNPSRAVMVILIASLIGFVVLAILIIIIVICVRRRQTPDDKIVQDVKNLKQSSPRSVRVEQESLGKGTNV